MRVCVYCASIEGIPPHYLQLAADVGAAVGDRGWELVSGGGRSAMMGALADISTDTRRILAILQDEEDDDDEEEEDT